MNSRPSLRKKRAVVLLEGQQEPSAALLDLLKGTSKEWIQTEALDDVFLSLLALHLHDSSFFDGETLALIARRLLASETKPGGPYGDGTLRDAEANAAIAQLFTRLEAPLPQTAEYVVAYSLKHPSASSLLNRLLIFPASLTKMTVGMPKKSTLKKDSIATAVERDIATLPLPLGTVATEVWKELSQTHSYHEITSLSADFAASLRDVPALTRRDLDALGQANVYFWMAYTIYDDFIDGEGMPGRISVANCMQRRSLALYGRLFPESPRLASYFDLVDSSNSWELEHCRFAIEDDCITIGALPAYRSGRFLAERSIGHVMGPLELLFLLNVASVNRLDAGKGFEHFLIARQLSDDLHDWQEDLSRGHISYVVAALLKGLKIKREKQNLGTLLSQLQAYFFADGFLRLCDEVLANTKKARAYFTKSGLFTDEIPFLEYIAEIEDTISGAKEEHRKGREFLANYQNRLP